MERHAGAQSATCREGGRPGPCSPPLPAALPHPHLGPDPMPLAAGPASVALPSGPPTKRPGPYLETYRLLRPLSTPDRPLCPVCRMPRCSLRTLPARHAPPPPSLRRLLQPRRPPPSSRPLLEPSPAASITAAAAPHPCPAATPYRSPAASAATSSRTRGASGATPANTPRTAGHPRSPARTSAAGTAHRPRSRWSDRGRPTRSRRAPRPRRAPHGAHRAILKPVTTTVVHWPATLACRGRIDMGIVLAHPRPARERLAHVRRSP